MIVRTVRCTIAEADAPSFLEHTRAVVAAHAGSVDGLLSLEMMVRRESSAELTTVGVSRWRDFASMSAYLGDKLYRPALWDSDERWLADAVVEHFEVVVSSRG
jgi:heme-degrading monooxygenase HmoA